MNEPVTDRLFPLATNLEEARRRVLDRMWNHNEYGDDDPEDIEDVEALIAFARKEIDG